MANSNDWIRTQLGFEEGAITTTADTVYAGFGLEGLAQGERDDLVARSHEPPPAVASGNQVCPVVSAVVCSHGRDIIPIVVGPTGMVEDGPRGAWHVLATEAEALPARVTRQCCCL